MILSKRKIEKCFLFSLQNRDTANFRLRRRPFRETAPTSIFRRQCDQIGRFLKVLGDMISIISIPYAW